MKLYIATYKESAEFINEVDKTVIIGVFETNELAEAQRDKYKGRMFAIEEYEIITE